MAETWRVSELNVDIVYVQDIPVVRAHGECDLITCRRLKEAADSLINTGHYRIAFDLRHMTHLDSSGFRILLEAANRTAEKGGAIALVSLTAPIERAFNLLRLGELIIRTSTVEKAVEKLKAI